MWDKGVYSSFKEARSYGITSDAVGYYSGRKKIVNWNEK